VSLKNQLLANCSPTVQSIVNAENKFTTLPPFDDEESDKEDDIDKEDNDELAEEVSAIKYTMGTVQNESNQTKLISLTQQLSPAMKDIKEKKELTASQQVYTTPFNNEEDDIKEDTSKQQPCPYEISNVSIYHQYCYVILYIN